MLTLQSNLIGKYKDFGVMASSELTPACHANLESGASILHGEVHQLFCPSCDNMMLDVTSGSSTATAPQRMQERNKKTLGDVMPIIQNKCHDLN